MKLLNRNDRYWLYVSLEKEVYLPRWEWCETAIGVDIGMNNLAVATAVNKDKIHKPLFVKGGLWKHLQLKKRAKIAKLQSKGAYTKDKWKYYNRIFDEMLHKTAKNIIEYAKQFDKPIIVLEDLGKFKNNTRSDKWNYLLTNWMRKRLQEYIEYKANWEGIPIIHVYPHYTSQNCCYCGNRGKRNGLNFECPVCGRKLNSDFNASVNIALRFLSQFIDKDIRHSLATKRINKESNLFVKGGNSLPQYSLRPDVLNKMKLMKVPEAEFN